MGCIEVIQSQNFTYVVLHVVVTTIEGQFFGLLPAVAISFCIQIDLKKAEKHYA